MSSKPLKTAGALRAGDTEFLHSDMRRERQTVPVEVLIQAMDHPDRLAALGWSVEDARAAVDAARKPKLSAILALRASKYLSRCGTVPNEQERADMIAFGFSVLDDLVECLRDLLEEYELQRSQHGSEYIWQKYEDVEVLNKARALLERIEKGTK